MVRNSLADMMFDWDADLFMSPTVCQSVDLLTFVNQYRKLRNVVCLDLLF